MMNELLSYMTMKRKAITTPDDLFFNFSLTFDPGQQEDSHGKVHVTDEISSDKALRFYNMIVYGGPGKTELPRNVRMGKTFFPAEEINFLSLGGQERYSFPQLVFIFMLHDNTVCPGVSRLLDIIPKQVPEYRVPGRTAQKINRFIIGYCEEKGVKIFYFSDKVLRQPYFKEYVHHKLLGHFLRPDDPQDIGIDSVTMPIEQHSEREFITLCNLLQQGFLIM
jgi:hypothetical protein